MRKGGKSSKDSLWWRDLKEVWSSEGWGQNFEDAIKWMSGTGKEIVFWEDNWVGNGALKEVFPRLFSLSLSKESKVAEFGAWNNGQWVCTFAWRRSLFEWEKQLECHFLQVVQGVCLDLEKEDSWVWKDGEGLSYTVNSAYNRLRRGRDGGMPLCSNSFEDVKPCLLHLLLPGGC